MWNNFDISFIVIFELFSLKSQILFAKLDVANSSQSSQFISPTDLLNNDNKPKSRSSKQIMHSNYEVYNLNKKQYNRLIMYLKIKGVYKDEY